MAPAAWLRQADLHIAVRGAVSNDFPRRQPLIPLMTPQIKVTREFGHLSIYGTRLALVKPDNEFLQLGCVS
jgi:hypothetical protein